MFVLLFFFSFAGKVPLVACGHDVSVFIQEFDEDAVAKVCFLVALVGGNGFFRAANDVAQILRIVFVHDDVVDVGDVFSGFYGAKSYLFAVICCIADSGKPTCIHIIRKLFHWGILALLLAGGNQQGSEQEQVGAHHASTLTGVSPGVKQRKSADS